MNPFKMIAALPLACLAAGLNAGTPAPEPIEGCQGEGCSCFADYRSSSTRGSAVLTVRPFTLHERMSKESRRIGGYASPVAAIPGKQIILIEDPGEYLVEKVQGGLASLAVGDRVNSLIHLGEGASRVRKGTQWIEFDEDQLTLKVVRPVQLTEWLEVTVGRLRGYAAESPFRACLE